MSQVWGATTRKLNFFVRQHEMPYVLVLALGTNSWHWVLRRSMYIL